MVKGITFLLIALAVLAMFGRFRIGRVRATTCKNCGRKLVGRARCPCGGPRGAA